MSHIDPRHIHISDYNYPLPDERIAKFPIAQRDHSKLLIYNKGVPMCFITSLSICLRAL